MKCMSEHGQLLTSPTPTILDVPKTTIQQPTTLSKTNKVLVTSATLATLVAIHPSTAYAAEAAPDGFFELILHTVESLGPLGPLVFILSVAFCECIPLFPTQPLSLASGLLFGAQKGALCMLSGTTLAALLAFTIARGVGRPLAERIIRAEMASDGSNSKPGHGGGGIVQQKLLEAQEAIERGTFWQQAGAIAVLRFTPIVPFSASNYVLGLSPLPLAPYLTGTMIGMAFWSAVYASFGGASRALLRRGADPDALLNELLEKVANMTEGAGYAAAALGIAGAVGYFVFVQSSHTSTGGARAEVIDESESSRFELPSHFPPSNSEDESERKLAETAGSD